MLLRLSLALRVVGVLFLLVGLLGLPACLSSDAPEAQNEEVRRGLAPDNSVDLRWPAAPQVERIRYYNVLENGAPWIDAGDLRISAPKAVALNADATRLYVASGYGVLVVDTVTGAVSEFADGVQAPHGLAVAPNGDLYVVDKPRATIAVFSEDGALIREMGAELGFVDPQGLAIDPERARLYVADPAADRVSAWTLEGEHLFDLEPSTDSALILPLAVAVNSQGLVYVVNWGPERVHIYDTEGTFVRGFGEEGIWSSQFVRPKGIAIDSDDNVYVTDAAFGNIQIFDSQDRLALWVGQTGNGTAELNMPTQMAIDSQDRIYVAEYGSHRVQIFQYTSP